MPDEPITEAQTPEQIAEAAKVAAEEVTKAEAAAKAAADGLDPALVDDDSEPGGADPQAVRARKEYRARKSKEVELQREREARIAAESRAHTLEEQAAKSAKTETSKPFTSEEVQAAVDAGTITPLQGADYLAQRRATEAADKAIAREWTRYNADIRTNTALASLNEYSTLVPWIKDKSDPRYPQLEAKYTQLTDPNGLYALPKSLTTDLLVLEQVLGPIDKIKQRREVMNKRDIHTEAGGGGAGPVKTNGVTDFSKAPKHFIEFWDKTGTSTKDREAEMKIYNAREARRKSA